MAVDESAKALRADAVHLAIALHFTGVRGAHLLGRGAPRWGSPHELLRG